MYLILLKFWCYHGGGPKRSRRITRTLFTCCRLIEGTTPLVSCICLHRSLACIVVENKIKIQIQKKKRRKYSDCNLHRTFPTAPPQKKCHFSESTHCSGSGTRVTAQRHVTPLSTRSDAAAACRLARAISDSGGGKWRVRCAGGVGSSPGSRPLFRCAG